MLVFSSCLLYYRLLATQSQDGWSSGGKDKGGEQEMEGCEIRRSEKKEKEDSHEIKKMWKK